MAVDRTVIGSSVRNKIIESFRPVNVKSYGKGYQYSTETMNADCVRQLSSCWITVTMKPHHLRFQLFFIFFRLLSFPFPRLKENHLKVVG